MAALPRKLREPARSNQLRRNSQPTQPAYSLHVKRSLVKDFYCTLLVSIYNDLRQFSLTKVC